MIKYIPIPTYPLFSQNVFLFFIRVIVTLCNCLEHFSNTNAGDVNAILL